MKSETVLLAPSSRRSLSCGSAVPGAGAIAGAAADRVILRGLASEQSPNSSRPAGQVAADCSVTPHEYGARRSLGLECVEEPQVPINERVGHSKLHRFAPDLLHPPVARQPEPKLRPQALLPSPYLRPQLTTRRALRAREQEQQRARAVEEILPISGTALDVVRRHDRHRAAGRQPLGLSCKIPEGIRQTGMDQLLLQMLHA